MSIHRKGVLKLGVAALSIAWAGILPLAGMQTAEATQCPPSICGPRVGTQTVVEPPRPVLSCGLDGCAWVVGFRASVVADNGQTINEGTVTFDFRGNYSCAGDVINGWADCIDYTHSSQYPTVPSTGTASFSGTTNYAPSTGSFPA